MSGASPASSKIRMSVPKARRHQVKKAWTSCTPTPICWIPERKHGAVIASEPGSREQDAAEQESRHEQRPQDVEGLGAEERCRGPAALHRDEVFQPRLHPDRNECEAEPPAAEPGGDRGDPGGGLLGKDEREDQ